jgi:hypothetical protein
MQFENSMHSVSLWHLSQCRMPQQSQKSQGCAAFGVHSGIGFPNTGFTRSLSSKLGNKNGVVIHAGTHPAEKLMAEK